MTTIALNMIVGPYNEPFLEAAVNSVWDICDEIILIDTAPGANPNRIVMEELSDCRIKKIPIKIIDMPRGEDKDFSYGEARELARVNTNSEWVLRLDADEVIHEDDIKKLKRATEYDCTSIQVEFYHFMVYPWLYQYVESKKILFKKDSFHWINKVHELPICEGRTNYLAIKYYHYGYCRGQSEVFKRWKLYRDIEGAPAWYDNLNPNEILTPRIPVSQNFKGTHPLVVQPVLDRLFAGVKPFEVKEIPKFNETKNFVGILLFTYNDYANLVTCINSFISTVDYPTFLHIVDFGSTDGTFDFLHSIDFSVNKNIAGVSVNQNFVLEPLAISMNKGFSSLMGRQECELIGWIHPDMIFEDGWLSELVKVLDEDKETKIGKVCSWNTRNGAPVSEDLLPGHEQCYLIRRGILLRVGLFDIRFIGIGGWEDIDLNRRIIKEGHRVVIVPKSRVFHKAMETRSRRNTFEEGIYNREEYRKKWGDNKDGELYV